MRVEAIVVGKPLSLPRAGTHPVGERIALDDDDPRHREAIEAGWVRPVEAARPMAAAPDGPEAHRMVSGATPKQRRRP